MQLSKVNSFPTRLPNWDHLNQLASLMIQVGAVNRDHTMEARVLIEKLPASGKNGYRILRDSPGFAPVRDDDTGTLRYYYEAEEMRALFGEEMTDVFYPRTFANAYRNIARQTQADLTIHEEGALVRINLGRQHTEGMKISEQYELLKTAREVADEKMFIRCLENLAMLALSNLYEARKAGQY